MSEKLIVLVLLLGGAILIMAAGLDGWGWLLCFAFLVAVSRECGCDKE